LVKRKRGLPHTTSSTGGADCLVYIDLNMVRAGVVRHPSEWPFCGYNEIQEPKRKNILINYNRLTEFLGLDSYDEPRPIISGALTTISVMEKMSGMTNGSEVLPLGIGVLLRE